MTQKEIIAALRHEVTEDGHILLDKLEAFLPSNAWVPELTFEAAVKVLGPQLHNPEGKTAKALTRRCRHALEVWTQKYGSLNDYQMVYADEVLASCVLRADSEEVRTKFGYALYLIGQAVNHERVHEGFKKRGGLREVEIS